MFDELKADILARLGFLSHKVNYRTTRPEIVYLHAYYTDKSTGCHYHLSVTVQVAKHWIGNKIDIRFFQILDITFYVNDDDTPPFSFSVKELNDYIDYW